jgi:hypothetical protein
MSAIPEGTRVEVRSGEAWFKGNIEEYALDFDQFVYKINGEWYCQSEVTPLCKYIKREGESCSLNNNCKFPNCEQ